MKLKESGIILRMEHYEEALDFYVNKIGLTIRSQKRLLAKLNFGGGYLMLEDRGFAAAARKTSAQNPVTIRLDVDDFDVSVQEIRDRGVTVDVHAFDSGTVGQIVDPEGNLDRVDDRSNRRNSPVCLI